MPLLVSRGLPSRAKDRLYFASVCSVMLYRRLTRTVEEEDVIWLERNDAKMVRWRCSVRPEDRISAEELGTKLELRT